MGAEQARIELLKEAEENDIEVWYRNAPLCRSIALDGYICLDCSLTGAEETECLAHELGHCITNSFYYRTSSDLACRKAERRADKYAIRKLVPKGELKKKINKGLRAWEIADEFGVPEPFLRHAVEYYRGVSL